MALIIADRVKEATTTTGTGSFTVSGAETGFRAFSAVCATSDTFYYAVQEVDGSGAASGDWETGFGTYSGTNTIARTTVLSSSNGGSAVDFGAGTKHIWIDFVAAEYRALRPVQTQTITVGASGFDYTTVSAAIASLNDLRIAQSATVTIEVQDEEVVESGEISITHPDADRIVIRGKTVYTTTLTSIQSTTGSIGAYAVTANVGSVANISVGDFIGVYGTTGGTNPRAFEGVWEVTNVDAVNTRVTATCTIRKANPPSGAQSGSIKIFKSRISFVTAGTSGLSGSAVGNGPVLQNIAVIGDQAASSGVVGVSGYMRAGADDDRLAVSGFYRGVEATGARGSYNNVIVSSAVNRGLSAVSFGGLVTSGAISSGNGGFGAGASTFAYLSFSSGFSMGNGDDGVVAYLGNSTLFANSAESWYNNAYGFFASGRSTIYAVGSTATGNATGTYSPAVNTYTANDNSYIDT